MSMNTTVMQTAARLARGQITSEALVNEALERALDPAGEGARVFMKVHAGSARAMARAADQARAHGIVPSPLAGLPVSVKDLFDVAGDVTRAGSKVLDDASPATVDARVVARLRAAGAIIVGRTGMTEFAYSGIGFNPHYGTPRNPFERDREFAHGGHKARGRIPGGSSSGAAVSVTDGMALVGLGTDTGGSVRIPAALCGITGFKPTARRVPRDGVYPLSSTLDSIGPLAPSVTCCAIVDAILAGEPLPVLSARVLEGMRLAVIPDLLHDGVEPAVAAAFERALSMLSAAGARVQTVAFEPLRRLPQINRLGGFSGAEAWALHRARLATDAHRYDQRVARRIEAAGGLNAADYVDLMAARATMIGQFERAIEGFDAVLAPSVARIAPPLAEIERDDEAFLAANGLILRNTAAFNFLDACGLSIPCHREGEPPVGLMVVAPAMSDARLLSVGLGIEGALASLRQA
jgi:aspartyl-tRNA(Asn)/glutamyl-tRNA(Gln) amidotransferase subunit A